MSPEFKMDGQFEATGLVASLSISGKLADFFTSLGWGWVQPWGAVTVTPLTIAIRWAHDFFHAIGGTGLGQGPRRDRATFTGQSSQAASHEMAERRASVGSAGSDFLILGTAGCKLLEVRPLTRLGNPTCSVRQRWLASLLKPSGYRQEFFTGNPNPHGRRLFLHLEQPVGGQNLHGGPAGREFHKVRGWPERFFRPAGYREMKPVAMHEGRR